jgi:DNA repair exonuclease SbcCD ATPase subunit
MRLISVRIRNFRAHDDLFVKFDPLRTVVAGPNESGKSTLVEAIDRVLFHPYRSTRDVSRLKPRATGATPEVIIEFERNGRTHTLRKVFKGAKSVATLTDDDGGEHHGEDADAHLRALLGLGDTASSKPSFGWSHLWTHQGEAGDDPMSPGSLGDVPRELDRRLHSIAGTAFTESARDGITSEKVAAAYEELFTTKGVKAGSPLDTAMKDLVMARTAAAAAATMLAEFEDAADTAMREQASIESHTERLAEAERALGETRPRVARIEQLETDLAHDRAAAETAKQEYDTLAEGDAEIVALGASIDGHKADLDPREKAIEALAERERTLRADVTQAASTISVAMNAHEKATTRSALVAKFVKLFALRHEHGELARARKQIDDLQGTIAAIDGRLRDLPVVDQESLTELEQTDRDLEIARGKLHAIATRIEVLRADGPVAVDDAPLAVGDARTLTEATELRVGDGTAVLITPGDGGSLAALRIEVSTLEAKLGSQLARLGVLDVRKARAAYESRTSELAARERDAERIELFGGDDTKKRLMSVAEEIENLAAGIALVVPQDFVAPVDADSLALAETGAEQALREAGRGLETARATVEQATQAADAARQAWEGAESQVRDLRKTIQTLEFRKAALETIHGVDRKKLLETRAERKKSAADAVTETDRALEKLDAASARADLERFERVVAQANQEIIAATERRANAQGRLRTAGMSDLHGAKASADARVDLATRHHDEVSRRAEAVRHLHELFQRRRQAMADLVAAPLREKMVEYLDALFGTGCRVLFTREEQSFAGFEVARPITGGLRFEFEDLSGGTREQVAAACRLAMAELLAGNGWGGAAGEKPCLPMIFDDAFTSSDPERIKSVQRVLDLGARRGLQIIVLTCTPKEYGLFGAKQVDLPPPKSTGVTLASLTWSTGDVFRSIDDADHEDGDDDAGDAPADCERPAAPAGGSLYLADGDDDSD